ncbi:MAG: bis(5'-nucleosyl)-tetraphosphatase (symmetrical) YqeK [Candidatus Marinamargulisbacteria bacterium]
MSATRLDHVIRVQKMAVFLAESHGLDTSSISVAALLHDIAKQHTPETLTALGLDVRALDDCWRAYPAVWHAFAGPLLVHHVFPNEPSCIDSMIECHTTGKANMSDNDMVVFIADFIEPGRCFPEREGLVSMATSNLKTTVATITEMTLKKLEIKQQAVHPLTQDCWAWSKSAISRYGNAI